MTRRGDVSTFAIAPSLIALGDADGNARIYDLQKGTILKTVLAVSHPVLVRASCGAVLFNDFDRSRDSVEPSGAPSKSLPCMRNLPAGADPIDYSFSANGQYWAFLQSIAGKAFAQALCTAGVGDAAKCFDPGDGGGDYSISDHGELLLTSPQGGDCYFNSVGAQAPATEPAPPRYEDYDKCRGIYLWDGKAIQGPLAKFAIEPQWIDSDQARSLSALVTKGVPFGKDQTKSK